MTPARRTIQPRLRASFLVLALGVALLAIAPLPPLGTAVSGAAQAAERYLEALPDLPLMPGFEEVPDAGVTFDKPEGRIVTAYAHGAAGAGEARSFYAEALPALGWRAAGSDGFEREGERLDIDYLGGKGDLTVRFTLQPR